MINVISVDDDGDTFHSMIETIIDELIEKHDADEKINFIKYNDYRKFISNPPKNGSLYILDYKMHAQNETLDDVFDDVLSVVSDTDKIIIFSGRSFETSHPFYNRAQEKGIEFLFKDSVGFDRIEELVERLIK